MLNVEDIKKAKSNNFQLRKLIGIDTINLAYP